MTGAPAGERASFRGRHALVLGLGRFDGGLGTVRFLCGDGANVLVSDTAERSTLEASAAAAEALGAELAFGPQTPDLLEGRDVVLVNPAVPFDHPVLEAARARDVPITTEINIVLARCPAPVFGVTGTKGKSTTAHLLAHMLRASGRREHLGGNIGASLVSVLDTIEPDDRVVLELSSFQLWWSRFVGCSPRVTAITNLLSDHLDRHGTHEHYAASKRAALDFQGPEDLAVLPADDDAVAAAGWLDAGAGRRVLYGRGGSFDLDGAAVVGPHGRAPIDGMTLLGAHNQRNALTAAAALWAFDETAGPAITAGSAAAEPLPHRLQPVAEVAGVLYIDDSNATQPESTRAALRALERPLVLILGGKEKGTDPSALLADVRARAHTVIAMGSSAPRIAAALDGAPPVVRVETVEEAVRAATSHARAGDVVLLSPGYSSLDQYVSFAERGDRFQTAVRALVV